MFYKGAHMPVQVLPPIPSFGSRLAEALGDAGGALGKAYFDRNRRQQDEKIIAGLGDSSLTPMQQIAQVAKLSKPAQKNVSTMMAPILKQRQEQDQLNDQMRQFGLIPGQQQGMNGSPLEQALNQSDQSNQQSSQFNPQNLTEDQLKAMLLIPQFKAFAQNEITSRRQSSETADRQLLDQVSSGAFGHGYRAIIDGDDQAFADIMEDEDVSSVLKKQLSDIKSQWDTRQSVTKSEHRRSRGEVVKAYGQALNSQRALLKDAFSKDERIGITKRLKSWRVCVKKTSRS